MSLVATEPCVWNGGRVWSDEWCFCLSGGGRSCDLSSGLLQKWSPCPHSPALIDNYGSEWSQGSLKWKNMVASVSLAISSDLTFSFVCALLFHWLCITISWPWWGPVRQPALDGKRLSKGKNPCGTSKKSPWGHWFLHHWASWVLTEFICINSPTCVCDLVCSKVVLMLVEECLWWWELIGELFY